MLDAYRDVAQEKGLVDLAQQLRVADEVAFRDAETEDAAALAQLHMDGINTGFLPRLGKRFMRRLYRAMVEWPGSVIVVAERGGAVAGYVAGVEDTDAFFAHFYRRHGVGAALAALPNLIRPAVLRRAWETARYSESGGGFAAAELLSMAVDPSARRQGIAARLGEDFLERMAQRGAGEVKVVVGAGNAPAIAAYQKMGFDPAGEIEVHPGERSMVLEWSE